MKRISLFIIISFCTIQVFAQSDWQLRLMSQAAFGTKNTIQRPNNDEGTRVWLNKEFDRKHAATFAPRIELEYANKRHHVIATAAFLGDKFFGEADKDILYNGTQFYMGEDICTDYRFNTYRIGYRYRLVDKSSFAFELGATILIRDAYISMNNDMQKTKYSNVGVAPLLSYYIEWKATDRFSLLSYGDAFAVKVGRAEDIFAGAKYQIVPKISATAGYRILEGGSDVDKVYTMATFHFASIGIGFDF